MANPAFRPGPDSEGLFSRARVFISTNEPWSPASPSLPLWILPLAAPWPCPAASPTRTRDPGALPPLSAASGSGAPLEAPGLRSGTCGVAPLSLLGPLQWRATWDVSYRTEWSHP